jgi:hypothetical protein
VISRRRLALIPTLLVALSSACTDPPTHPAAQVSSKAPTEMGFFGLRPGEEISVPYESEGCHESEEDLSMTQADAAPPNELTLKR